MIWKTNGIIASLLLLSVQTSFSGCLLDYLLCRKCRYNRPKSIIRINTESSKEIPRAIEMTRRQILNPLNAKYTSTYQESTTHDKNIQGLIIFKSGRSICPTGTQAIAMIEDFRAKDQILMEELPTHNDGLTFLTVYTTI